MTETTCAMCGTRDESQWQIRLERETVATDEQSPYRLCRGCWDALGEEFSVPGSGSP